MDGSEYLAAAICEQAIDDYRRARQYLKRDTYREIQWIQKHYFEQLNILYDFGFDEKTIRAMTYKIHRIWLRKRHDIHFHEENLKTATEFMKSGRFEFYCGIDGKKVLQKIKRECDHGKYKKPLRKE